MSDMDTLAVAMKASVDATRKAGRARRSERRQADVPRIPVTVAAAGDVRVNMATEPPAVALSAAPAAATDAGAALEERVPAAKAAAVEPYTGNPLLTRYADAALRSESNAATALPAQEQEQEQPLRSFYAELAADATRIARLHLGIDTAPGVHFLWEPMPDAHPSRVTGRSVALWSAPSPALLPESLCGPSSRVVRSECVIRARREDIARLMLDDARSVEYDKYVNSYRILFADEATASSVRHYTYDSVWPTSARDLVVLSTRSKQKDGSILISTVSLPDRLVPVAADHVRARVLSSCCLITPRPRRQQGQGQEEEEEEECTVTFVSHINPGGSVPKALTNWLGPQNSQNTLRNARDLLEAGAAGQA